MNRSKVLSRTGSAAATVLVMLSLAVPGWSQWKTNGELLEDAADQKTVDGFGAWLIVTDDPEGLFEAWARPPSPDYGPAISMVSSAHRGDVVMATVVFSGCAENTDGVCDTSITYTAYFPDGSVYGRHSGTLWSGYPNPGNGHVQLSADGLGLKVELDDPFGTYRVTAGIVDNVSGVEMILETELSVIEID